MAAPFFWRDKLFYFITEKYHAYLIVILDGRKSKHRTYFGSQILLLLTYGAKIFRTAYVHQQHYGQLTFFVKHFNVRMVKTRGYVPVDSSYFITYLVFAHLAKSH